MRPHLPSPLPNILVPSVIKAWRQSWTSSQQTSQSSSFSPPTSLPPLTEGDLSFMWLLPSQLHCTALLCSALFSTVSSHSSSHKALVHIFGQLVCHKAPCGLWEHSVCKEHKRCDVLKPKACILYSPSALWRVYVHVHVLFSGILFSFGCATVDVLFTDRGYWLRYVLCYIMGVFSAQWQNCSIIVSWPCALSSLPHSLALSLFSLLYPSTCVSVFLSLHQTIVIPSTLTSQWYGIGE